MTVRFSSYDVLAIFISIFLPPLGVFLEKGIMPDFWINIALTILGWIPGVIHAFYIISKNRNDPNSFRNRRRFGRSTPATGVNTTTGVTPATGVNPVGHTTTTTTTPSAYPATGATVTPQQPNTGFAQKPVVV